MNFCCEYDVEEYQKDENFYENSLDREDLRKIVGVYVRNYFKDKEISPEVDLYSNKYLDMCIDTNICDAVDSAYSAMERSGKFEFCSDEHSISEDIRLVIRILAQIKKHAPQEFSAGILLMHLDILEGLKF